MTTGLLLALASGVGMLAVSLIAVLAWRRGRPGIWPAVGLGALAWFIGVALKIAWAVLTNKHVLGAIAHALPAGPITTVTSAVYLGLLTGIFECGIVLLVVRRSRLRNASWNEAVAAGLGKGAIEAFLLGAIVTVPLLAIIIAHAIQPTLLEHEAAEIAARTTVASMIERPFERISALLGHTFSTALIVHAVRTKQLRWFWLSFAWLSAVDMLASLGVDVFGKEAFSTSPALWVGLTLAGLAALVALLWLRRRFLPAARPDAALTGPQPTAG